MGTPFRNINMNAKKVWELNKVCKMKNKIIVEGAKVSHESLEIHMQQQKSLGQISN